MTTLMQYQNEVQTYGYVGNCKALFELGPELMVTEGIENQLDLANKIIASATFIKEQCLVALIEKP